MRSDLAQSERPVKFAVPRQIGATRLLIITIDAPFLVTHRLSLARAAREAGYDVAIAGPIDPGSGRGDLAAVCTIREAGLTYHEIPLRRASTSPLNELKLLAALDALLKQVKPDLIHCVGMKPVLYAGAIARLRRIPAVHAVTGLGTTFMGEGVKAGLGRFALLRAFAFAFANPRAHVIFQNPDDRALFARARVIDSRHTFLVRGTGADLKVFRPLSAGDPRREGLPVVMLAARLIAAKGVREFAGAAKRLAARGLKARFVLLGQRDPENPTCISETELAQWQEAGTLEWWGHATDMAKALRQADIFCLPSYYREGIPKVLIEAAATGLPIVTTDMPGCREVVRHGYNGLLVPPRDEAALDQALERLLSDATFRQEAGVRSREVAAAEFSLDAFLTASLAVYQAALEIPTRAASA